jgi:hypothetical protein
VVGPGQVAALDGFHQPNVDGLNATRCRSWERAVRTGSQPFQFMVALTRGHDERIVALQAHGLDEPLDDAVLRLQPVIVCRRETGPFPAGIDSKLDGRHGSPKAGPAGDRLPAPQGFEAFAAIPVGRRS